MAPSVDLHYKRDCVLSLRLVNATARRRYITWEEQLEKDPRDTTLTNGDDGDGDGKDEDECGDSNRNE